MGLNSRFGLVVFFNLVCKVKWFRFISSSSLLSHKYGWLSRHEAIIYGFCSSEELSNIQPPWAKNSDTYGKICSWKKTFCSVIIFESSLTGPGGHGLLGGSLNGQYTISKIIFSLIFSTFSGQNIFIPGTYFSISIKKRFGPGWEFVILKAWQIFTSPVFLLSKKLFRDFFQSHLQETSSWHFQDILHVWDICPWPDFMRRIIMYVCISAIIYSLVSIIRPGLITYIILTLPLYWSYNRVIWKIFKTVLVIETVLISILLWILIARALQNCLF